jgi:hypothetical protein
MKESFQLFFVLDVDRLNGDGHGTLLKINEISASWK